MIETPIFKNHVIVYFTIWVSTLYQKSLTGTNNGFGTHNEGCDKKIGN